MREPLRASAVASPQTGPLLRATARRLRCCPPCQASRLGCVGTPSIHPVLATTRLMRDIEIGSSLFELFPTVVLSSSFVLAAGFAGARKRELWPCERD